MKKRIAIFGTLIGLVLAMGIFVVGVVAAMSHEFGINNSIHFLGKGEYVKFDLTGVITGTRHDGADYLSTNWSYDWSDVNSKNSNEWNISEPLEFKENEGAQTKYSITYTFTITNNSVGNTPLKAKIVPQNIDAGALNYTVPTNDITIAFGTTGTLQLIVSPTSEEGFAGNRDCCFEIVIESELDA